MLEFRRDRELDKIKERFDLTIQPSLEHSIAFINLLYHFLSNTLLSPPKRKNFLMFIIF